MNVQLKGAKPPAPRHQPPTPISGHGDFFAGKIGFDLRVGALELPGAKEGAEPGARGGGHRRGGGMGGGMSMGMGGGGGGGRHPGGPPPGEPGGGGRPEGVRPMMASMGPAEMIHLQFTNRGSERVTLEIVDFVSPLGNFAVQPAKLVLEPGQSFEVEPMSSRLAGTVSEVEASLGLRLAGKTEKQTVVLRAVAGGTPEASVPPAK